MYILRLISALFVLVFINGLQGMEKENDPLWLKAREWLYMPGEEKTLKEKPETPKVETITLSEEKKRELAEEKLRQASAKKSESTSPEPTTGQRTERKNFFERFFDEVIQSDPLGVSKFKKTINERDVFDPLNPKLFKFDGFSRSLGNRISFARDLGKKRSAGVHFGYYPLKLKDNFDHMKMDSMDLSVSFRQYFREKYLFQANAGVRRYQPNQGYRNFYGARNQSFDPEDLPFLYVAVGRRLVKRLPVIKRPLVLTASYSFSEDLKYPSADPYGYTHIDLSGFDLGLSIRFKI